MNYLFKVHKEKSRNTFFYFLFSILFASFSYSQETIKDTTQLDEVLVKAVRVNKETPVSFSNLNKKEIENRNLGQDIPVLLNFMPSVVTTSDAGNGFGYTGIRMRGSDATRVNVTLNGIPYNDSESHGTYFVDMPDFASSLQSVQLQRGVGTSTNGAGAFGASLNMLTESYSKKAFGEINNSFGSFNSRKHTLKFSTGVFNNKFEVSGRISALASDGYIQRASSNLKSYFLQGNYIGKTTLIKTLFFGGKEKTYQAWNGIDADKLQEDRTYNYAGMYYDENGNIQFYNNEVDDYKQHHFQLHWNEKLSQNWNSNIAIHYTKGKGFYENYKEDTNYNDYTIIPFDATVMVDLARQKWLDNDFYGATFSANYKTEKLDFVVGGAYNQYKGKHFGKVVWTSVGNLQGMENNYYNYFGNKNDGNLFTKINYKINKKWSLFSDLQYRNITYTANGVYNGEISNTFNFLNPKAGITYTLDNKNNFYISFAKANREPNRTDYENNTIKPEQLNDYELGWRSNNNGLNLNWNLYYMSYKNQLILTGQIDDIGNPIRANTEKSYRFGTEIDAQIKLSKKLFWTVNTTFSVNKNQNILANKNTDIAYSPNVIAGSNLSFTPIKNLSASILQKFVGSQYMNNIESHEAKLNDYFTTDLNLIYKITPKAIFENITITALINNVFAKEYSSNGYMWDIYPYYFPQAKRNFLIGLNFKNKNYKN
jgi:iron complex outermembrane receptor protein